MSRNIVISGEHNRTVRYQRRSPSTKTKCGILERYTYKTDTGELLTRDISFENTRCRHNSEKTQTIRIDCDSTTDVDYLPKNQSDESDSDCQIVGIQIPTNRKKIHTNKIYMIYSGAELDTNKSEEILISDSEDENVQINKLTSSRLQTFTNCLRRAKSENNINNASTSYDNDNEPKITPSSSDDESLEPAIYEISDNIRIALPKINRKINSKQSSEPLSFTRSPKQPGCSGEQSKTINECPCNEESKPNKKPRIEIISNVLINKGLADSTTPLFTPPTSSPWKGPSVTERNIKHNTQIIESIPSNKEIFEEKNYKIQHHNTFSKSNEDLTKLKKMKRSTSISETDTVKQLHINSDRLNRALSFTEKTKSINDLETLKQIDHQHRTFSFTENNLENITTKEYENRFNTKKCENSCSTKQYENCNTESDKNKNLLQRSILLSENEQKNDNYTENFKCQRVKKSSPRTSNDDIDSIPLSKYPRLDPTLSPETMKSEFYSYLKINTNPNLQKTENTIRNRRSIRVRNLYKENDNRYYDNKLKENNKSKENNKNKDSDTCKEKDTEINKSKEKDKNGNKCKGESCKSKDYCKDKENDKSIVKRKINFQLPQNLSEEEPFEDLENYFNNDYAETKFDIPLSLKAFKKENFDNFIMEYFETENIDYKSKFKNKKQTNDKIKKNKTRMLLKKQSDANKRKIISKVRRRHLEISRYQMVRMLRSSRLTRHSLLRIQKGEDKKNKEKTVAYRKIHKDERKNVSIQIKRIKDQNTSKRNSNSNNRKMINERSGRKMDNNRNEKKIDNGRSEQKINNGHDEKRMNEDRNEKRKNLRRQHDRIKNYNIRTKLDSKVYEKINNEFSQTGRKSNVSESKNYCKHSNRRISNEKCNETENIQLPSTKFKMSVISVPLSSSTHALSPLDQFDLLAQNYMNDNRAYYNPDSPEILQEYEHNYSKKNLIFENIPNLKKESNIQTKITESILKPNENLYEQTNEKSTENFSKCKKDLNVQTDEESTGSISKLREEWDTQTDEDSTGSISSLMKDSKVEMNNVSTEDILKLKKEFCQELLTNYSTINLTEDSSDSIINDTEIIEISEDSQDVLIIPEKSKEEKPKNDSIQLRKESTKTYKSIEGIKLCDESITNVLTPNKNSDAVENDLIKTKIMNKSTENNNSINSNETPQTTSIVDSGSNSGFLGFQTEVSEKSLMLIRKEIRNLQKRSEDEFGDKGNSTRNFKRKFKIIQIDSNKGIDFKEEIEFKKFKIIKIDPKSEINLLNEIESRKKSNSKKDTHKEIGHKKEIESKKEIISRKVIDSKKDIVTKKESDNKKLVSRVENDSSSDEVDSSSEIETIADIQIKSEIVSESDRRSQIESGSEFDPEIDKWLELSNTIPVLIPRETIDIPLRRTNFQPVLTESTVSDFVHNFSDDILQVLSARCKPRHKRIGCPIFGCRMNHSSQDNSKNLINQQSKTNLIELDKTARVKPFHRSLQLSSKTDSSIDPFQEEINKTQKQTHQVTIDNQDGPVFCSYYVDGTLILIQEYQIGFWKQTPLGNVLGASNMWYSIGKTKRYVFEKGCVCRRAYDMVSSTEGSVAYIEVWTKEHSSEFRQLPVTDIFVTIYHHKGYGALDKKVLQLENIKGYGKNVRYCVMRYSREIVVSWRDQLDPKKTYIRSFELSSDFQTIINIREFKNVYEELTSMHIITSCDSLVIGATENKLFVWNVKHGWLVKTIDFKDNSPILEPKRHLCLRALCETGYLFVIQQTKKRFIRLVAVNGVSGQWKQLQLFRIPRSYNTLLGTSTESGTLMLSYPNGFLCYDMQSGKLLAETEFQQNRIVLPADKFLVYVTENGVSVKHVMLHILEYENSHDDLQDNLQRIVQHVTKQVLHYYNSTTDIDIDLTGDSESFISPTNELNIHKPSTSGYNQWDKNFKNTSELTGNTKSEFKFIENFIHKKHSTKTNPENNSKKTINLEDEVMKTFSAKKYKNLIDSMKISKKIENDTMKMLKEDVSTKTHDITKTSGTTGNNLTIKKMNDSVFQKSKSGSTKTYKNDSINAEIGKDVISTSVESTIMKFKNDSMLMATDVVPTRTLKEKIVPTKIKKSENVIKSVIECDILETSKNSYVLETSKNYTVLKNENIDTELNKIGFNTSFDKRISKVYNNSEIFDVIHTKKNVKETLKQNVIIQDKFETFVQSLYGDQSNQNE